MGGFPQRADFAMGRFRDGRIAAAGQVAQTSRSPPPAGQVAQTCGFQAAASRPERPRVTDRAERQPLGLVSSGGAAAPRSWGSGRRRAVGLARLRRVECWSRRRQRSWPQGGVLFNSGILCGASEFWLVLRLVGLSGSLLHCVRCGFCVGLARQDFCVGLARRKVKNFMLWAEPSARQNETVQA